MERGKTMGERSEGGYTGAALHCFASLDHTPSLFSDGSAPVERSTGQSAPNRLTVSF